MMLTKGWHEMAGVFLFYSLVLNAALLFCIQKRKRDFTKYCDRVAEREKEMNAKALIYLSNADVRENLLRQHVNTPDYFTSDKFKEALSLNGMQYSSLVPLIQANLRLAATEMINPKPTPAALPQARPVVPPEAPGLE